MKKYFLAVILITLFIGTALSSTPVRAGDGCIVRTENNRYDSIPFYLFKGNTTVEMLSNCPTHEHFRKRVSVELMVPMHHQVVGHFISFPGTGGSYIEVDHTADVKYFHNHDVYDLERNEWNFVEFRK